MEPQPAEEVPQADLLVLSQALGDVRDSLVELSLALQDARFNLAAEERDETTRQLWDLLDQIRGGKSGHEAGDQTL